MITLRALGGFAGGFLLCTPPKSVLVNRIGHNDGPAQSYPRPVSLHRLGPEATFVV